MFFTVTTKELLHILRQESGTQDLYKQSDFNMSEVLSTLFQAGIKDEQLEFALEPEAAAVYVKETKVTKQRVSVDQHDLVPFPSGTQFMVLDLGGGL